MGLKIETWWGWWSVGMGDGSGDGLATGLTLRSVCVEETNY